MSQAGLNNANNIPPPPGSVTDLQGQDGVTVPPNGSGIIFVQGSVVAAGSTPFTTTGNAGTNTETWKIQLSQAIAATDATKVGLAAFNSANFTVDANGFVSTIATASINKVAVDASTAPGTNPVLPDGSGQITVTGAQIAAGSTPNVIRTDSLAANAYTIEIQRSQAVAVSTIADNGVAHFNASDFTVDANGFVSSRNPVLPWIDIGVSITLSVNTGYFVTAATTQTLPAVPSQGNTVKIICDTASAVVVTASPGQTIRLSSNASSVGGTFTNTARGDALELFYRAATSQWIALNAVGNWTIA